MNAPRFAGEKHSRLTGRVSAADDNDIVPCAETTLDRCRRIVHTLTFEASEVRDVQTSVSCTRSHDDGPCRDNTAALHAQSEGNAGAVQACRRPCDGEPCTEFLGLDLRPTCKRLARNAGGEAQIVLDARSAASLSTRTYRLDDNRVWSLRSSVHRRSKARRSR